MLPRMKLTSTFLLLAFMLSFIPAGTSVGYAAQTTVCDQAELVADVTVPDGTNFAPGVAFKKTWRLKNIGTCTWATTYTLVFDSGEKMGGPASVNLAADVAPGQTVDLSVDLTAPGTLGNYFGYWKVKNAAGALFGAGPTANKAIWVNIVVATDYNFTANAASATWSSGAGALTFPGTDGNTNGFALKLDKPKFEDGIDTYGAGLLVAPNNAAKGYIQAVYPTFKVQSGDRFQSRIGCQDGATGCYVAYRLQYQIDGSTEIKTFWKEPPFREKYERLTYPVNIDLSSLAGQNVKFILSVSDYDGSAVGDRALWGNPRITRSGGTTPPPAGSCTDYAKFISDLDVPDGKTFTPGEAFTKTWRLQNIGTCTWTTAYQLIFDTGEKMSAVEPANLPIAVAPGNTVDISIRLIAPGPPAVYTGYWKFKNDKGVNFALAPNGNKLLGNQKSFWVKINVAGTGTVTSYDFTSNAASAVWTSGTGAVAYPGVEGSTSGFILKKDKPKLENGTESAQAGLLFVPNNVSNGFIQGLFPLYKVKAGDRFRSIVGCEYGAASCNVTFSLDYLVGTSTEVKTLWTYVEKSDGISYQADIDLSALAGQDVKFFLTLRADGSLAVNRGLWVAPQIVSRQ